ncbi:MAG: aminoacyl-tRNA hydrolase [Elusimicrobia bacterium RIFOXYA2_FULL_39_19]|nr:MAG: aminoacyl-tRNA hydrolase [Elusimicrobia bacterium RIFOXYA2_FULL_39_19]
MKIIAGLGNPGKEYEFTRHNMGFLVVEKLAELLDIEFKVLKSINSAAAQHENLVLLKPLTFMNLSGNALKESKMKFNAKTEDLLVVCDDFSIPLGKMRIRFKGSSGGHNGLESIINTLGTQEFSRLRLGIGPLPDKSTFENQDPKNFVLGRFSKNETEKVKKTVSRAAELLNELVKSGNNPAVIEKINTAVINS